jgi:hypothetical protein
VYNILICDTHAFVGERTCSQRLVVAPCGLQCTPVITVLAPVYFVVFNKVKQPTPHHPPKLLSAVPTKAAALTPGHEQSQEDSTENSRTSLTGRRQVPSGLSVPVNGRPWPFFKNKTKYL